MPEFKEYPTSLVADIRLRQLDDMRSVLEVRRVRLHINQFNGKAEFFPLLDWEEITVVETVPEPSSKE